MNKKNFKKFILKYILPSLVIQGLFLLDVYIDNGKIEPFGVHRIIIFLFILFFVNMFWAFLWYLQDTVGLVMKSSFLGKIVFVLIALSVIYLYRTTGRI